MSFSITPATTAAAVNLKRPATSPYASPSKPSASSVKRTRTSYEYYEGEMDDSNDDEEEEDFYAYLDDDEDDWSGDEDDQDDEEQAEIIAEDQVQRQLQAQGQDRDQRQARGEATAEGADGIGDLKLVDYYMSMMNMDDCHARMQIDDPQDDHFAKFLKEAYRKVGGAGPGAVVLAAVNAVHAGVHRDANGNLLRPAVNLSNGMANPTALGMGSEHLAMPGLVMPGFTPLSDFSSLRPDPFNSYHGGYGNDYDSSDLNKPRLRKDAVIAGITVSQRRRKPPQT
ncbi:hypothetical protein BD289DRAFT_484353 [Coniella lustricola]|uniref:Uncharacterized protein n=1 Tax=Coniella lustricola TaxID=2025994 RepID=A0A2T3A2C3_9PEZI|nr:hypothetical protein BD289DRAFT_484353 [Coniella lustricola]